jgi:hypothetical protein
LNRLSFDIYEHINSGFSKEEISKKFNVPIWIIDNIQKNGFIEKLDEEFEKFYDFINRNFIFDVKIISKMTGIKESKVLKFLKMIKRNELFSSDEVEIIFKIYQEKRIDELTEIFNNYIKDSFIHNLRPFKEIDIKNVKDWVLPQKLIIDFYFNPTEETFKNFEFYSKKYKDENKILTYYLILLYKTSAINNFCSLKDDFIEVREIYYEIYDKVKNILPKILLFELNKQSALSSLKILDKGLFNKAIKEMNKLLKLLNEEYKTIAKMSLFYLYIQYGNYKKAYEFIKNLDDNLEHIKEAKLIIEFSKGNYKEIIKIDYQFSIKLSNLNYQFLKAFSYLMLSNHNQAIEIIKNMQRVENVKEIPLFLARFYIFLSIYHKMFFDDEKSKEFLKNVMNYQSYPELLITKAFYYEDSSYLEPTTIAQSILKYWIEGRINKAIELARNNWSIHFLKVCSILLPKNLKKLKKYEEFSDVINYSKKPFIKLFILREEPILYVGNKTYKLRDNEVSASIIKILRRKQLPSYLFNKSTLRYLRKFFKSSLSIRKNEVILSAIVYCDYDEFLTIYRIIETTRNKDELRNALERIKKIFKGLMFSNKEYIRSSYIEELRKEIEHYLKKIKFYSKIV